jgi:hypothetical protein
MTNDIDRNRTMTYVVLDPTNEAAPPVTQLAPRLPTLAGKKIGFISNGKVGTVGYFAHLERLLKAEMGASEVILRLKSNASKPADDHIIEEIPQWDVVIAGIGD